MGLVESMLSLIPKDSIVKEHWSFPFRVTTWGSGVSIERFLIYWDHGDCLFKMILIDKTQLSILLRRKESINALS